MVFLSLWCARLMPRKGTFHPLWAPSSPSHSLCRCMKLPFYHVRGCSYTISTVLKIVFLTHSLIVIRPPQGISEALCIVQSKEGDNVSGFHSPQIISYVSYLRRLDSITHSVFLKLCYILVPEPIITMKQVDFRPNCTGKWHFAFLLALWREHILLQLLYF